MSKKFRYLRISILIIAIALAIFANGGLSLTVNKTALAVGDLSVDWGVPSGNPIFVVGNLAPGQMEQRSVGVTNSGVISRTVGVRSELVTETGNLGDVLQIVISESGNDLYGGTLGTKTLSDFFADSANPVGIPLSDLSPSTSTTYVFKVLFDETSGNEFQDQSIVFDLIIGITVDVPQECTGMVFDNVIFGSSGNDNIKATGKSELIFGLEGTDKIDGGGGNDCIVGGEGNDKLEGGTGNDVLIDLFGNNQLGGGTGNDLLIAGAGNDKMEGGSGNDEIQGGSGNDNIESGSDNDKVYGGEGNDQIDGGSGDDELFGEAGNDKLEGGSGNDFLDGGLGTDNLNGQSGNADRCINGPNFSNCELF